MSEIEITKEHLRRLIGRRLNYRGVHCQIIEVLEDEGFSVVLEEFTPETVIQANQYGEAHRRVAPVFIIPLHDSVAGELNPVLLALLKDI